MADPTTFVTKSQLFARYQDLPAAVKTQNGVLLVGTANTYRPYDLTAGTGLLGQYTGATLAVAWPNLGTSETVTQSSATVHLVNAIVRFYSEAVSSPTSAQGTQYGAELNKITHNSAGTIWTGTSYTVALNAPLAVGDYVKLDDGTGGHVLHTRVTGFEAIGGSLKVLVLADSLPAALQSGYFNVSVGQVADLDLANSVLTTSSTTVTVPASLTTTTSRLGAAYPIIGATTASSTVLGNAYVSYSAVYAGSFSGEVQKLYTAANVASTFRTYLTAESGLGFAAHLSTAPEVVGYPTPPVLVIAPASETLGGYQSIIDLVQFRPDYSTVVVLSEDATVIAAFKAMLETRAASGQPTSMFFGTTFTTDEQIGSSTVATIDDSQTTGEDRTITVATGAPFATAIAGDTVRHYTSPSVYNTYIIQTVISAQAVTVTTEVPGAPLSNQTIQVWHHLTTAEQVAAVIAEAQSYASSSMNLVFPDSFLYNGTAVSSKFMAAWLASLRSYSPPQNLLTLVSPDAPWTSASLVQFSGYDSQLAAGGLFVFDTTTAGTLYVRYPRTTDQTTTANAHEILVASKQFAERYIYSKLTPFLGLYRVSTDLYSELRGAAVSAINQLVNTNITGIGSVIAGGTVGNIARSQTNTDTVIVPITLNIRGLAEDVLQLNVTVTLTAE